MSDICELVSFQILTPSHYQFSIFSQRIWRCLELVRLPTHKFVTFQLTAEYLSLNIFLKESGVGPITNSQICNIDVDWWLLVIKLKGFWRCLELVQLPTHKFVTFQLTAEYLSLNWWYFWRCPELARLPTHKFVTFQLTAEYLSLNWWYFWRCPELARLPTHKFVTFQLTAEYLSLNWWYFWRCPELARLPTQICQFVDSLNWWYFWRCQLTNCLSEYLSLNWWYFWRSPELARLPTHKFVILMLTGDYLLLNW